MENQISNQQYIEAVLVNFIEKFLPIIESWEINQYSSYRISDGYEADYDENYTPAVGAVILAQAIKNGWGYEGLYSDYCNRASVLLNYSGTLPFQKVFLLHYTCISILLLPIEKQTWAKELVKENFNKFLDSCGILNTNCAALQLFNELFLSQLNIRPVNLAIVEHLLEYLETAQLDSGFINDCMKGEAGIDLHHLDGMPIPYHAFILFVLICGLFYVDFREEHQHIRRKIEKIVNNGLKWLEHAETEDGSFAMAGRGKYHNFTRGIHCAMHAYRGDMHKLSRSLQYWSSFLRPDGTYDVTLNHLPHNLRVGYENYARVGMYNLLGLAALAVSLDFINNPHPEKKSIFPIKSKKNIFYDYSSGYAFFHKDSNFLAVNLLKRSASTQQLAMETFHLRINGMATPLAEPFFDQSKAFDIRKVNDQLFEGCVVKCEDGNWQIPIFEKAEILKTSGEEVVLKSENDLCSIKKTIQISNTHFSISYQLKPQNKISQILQTLPLCVSDGQSDLRINKLTEKTANLLFGNQNYQLRCLQSTRSELLMERSLKSVSGVSTRFQFLIDAIPRNEGDDIQWQWELEYLGESSPELPINARLDYPDPLMHIHNVRLEYQKPAQIGSKIRIITDAVGNELEYAWYILERAKVGYDRIHVQWYLKENEFIWEPTQTGTFVVQPFIRDKDQHKTSMIWHEIIDVE